MERDDIVQIPRKTLELVKAILDDECEGRSLHLTPQCDGWKAKVAVDAALAQPAIPDGLYVNGERHVKAPADNDYDLHRKAVHQRGIAASNALWALGWKFEGEQWIAPAIPAQPDPAVMQYLTLTDAMHYKPGDQLLSAEEYAAALFDEVQRLRIAAENAAERMEVWNFSSANDIARNLRAALAATAPAQPDRWRYVKTGATYTEVGRGLLKDEVGGLGWQDAVIYRSEADGAIYVRPADQFNDGRFERFCSATDTKGAAS